MDHFGRHISSKVKVITTRRITCTTCTRREHSQIVRRFSGDASTWLDDVGDIHNHGFGLRRCSHRNIYGALGAPAIASDLCLRGNLRNHLLRHLGCPLGLNLRSLRLLDNLRAVRQRRRICRSLEAATKDIGCLQAGATDTTTVGDKIASATDAAAGLASDVTTRTADATSGLASDMAAGAANAAAGLACDRATSTANAAAGFAADQAAGSTDAATVLTRGAAGNHAGHQQRDASHKDRTDEMFHEGIHDGFSSFSSIVSWKKYTPKLKRSSPSRLAAIRWASRLSFFISASDSLRAIFSRASTSSWTR